eukprot:3843231-Rhodomonas_salina.1
MVASVAKGFSSRKHVCPPGGGTGAVDGCTEIRAHTHTYTCTHVQWPGGGMEGGEREREERRDRNLLRRGALDPLDLHCPLHCERRQSFEQLDDMMRRISFRHGIPRAQSDLALGTL